jgi:hypothetical protein
MIMMITIMMTIISHLQSTRTQRATYVLQTYAAHPIKKSWFYCRWRPHQHVQWSSGAVAGEEGQQYFLICTGNYFSGVKQPKRKADHPTLHSNVEITNKWSYTSTPQLAFTNSTGTTSHHTGLFNTAAILSVSLYLQNYGLPSSFKINMLCE